jgi:hypothetical protein
MKWPLVHRRGTLSPSPYTQCGKKNKMLVIRDTFRVSFYVRHVTCIQLPKLTEASAMLLRNFFRSGNLPVCIQYKISF